MYRRISHIFISILCWFATAITIACANQPSPISFAENHTQSGENIEKGDAGFYDDGPETAGKKGHLARFRMRFLVNRSVDINAILPVWESIAGYIPQHIHHLYTKYEIRTATRPAYYNFLFRLSPF
ncbi:hypothetical protein EOD41_18910 [Mucilaginibacter limnophilus]|uniref:Uncharacterized protein n=1 Tax=Mucilaginibacter limnophilus TaxID=1932778 RepID=A0A3S2UJL7_9SPHI|nr:hypothetical protein [Mucilaginibacter limnophilus]RVT97367.1 hypothetical protein EOD41_18910 [Mucilaginibacter limnophilus]